MTFQRTQLLNFPVRVGPLTPPPRKVHLWPQLFKNHYPVDKFQENQLLYRVDRDLSDGQRYPPFKQLWPGAYFFALLAMIGSLPAELKFRQNTVFPSHLASAIPEVTAQALLEQTWTGSLKQLPIIFFNNLQTVVVYHLQKSSRKSSWKEHVNETRPFGLFQWKFPGATEHLNRQFCFLGCNVPNRNLSSISSKPSMIPVSGFSGRFMVNGTDLQYK